jgi:hypothetical protein
MSALLHVSARLALARISIEFDIVDLYENLSENLKISLHQAVYVMTQVYLVAASDINLRQNRCFATVNTLMFLTVKFSSTLTQKMHCCFSVATAVT